MPLKHTQAHIYTPLFVRRRIRVAPIHCTTLYTQPVLLRACPGPVPHRCQEHAAGFTDPDPRLREVPEQKSEKVIEQWHNLSIQLGHRVKLIYNGQEFSGNCIGIDPEKGLILQLDTGGVRMFDACHTSIAK